jgi:hypothetical protein
MIPGVWSCLHQPNDTVKTDLSDEEIRAAVSSGEGTIWVDIDIRNPTPSHF